MVVINFLAVFHLLDRDIVHRLKHVSRQRKEQKCDFVKLWKMFWFNVHLDWVSGCLYI